MSLLTVTSQTESIFARSRPDAIADDFVEVFERHYGRVVRALQLSGLDKPAAEDAAQEAFARSFSHWERVRTGPNPAGYVFKTAFRIARRTLKARDAAPLHLVVDPVAPEDVGSEATTRAAAEAALSAMPGRRRSCAVMCFVVGFSTKETASALGIAEGTVRKQLELARRSLKEALSDTA